MTSDRAELDPRAAAGRVAERLMEAGFETYFAGGCVRDRLLGLAPADYDVATSAVPDEVVALFPRARGVGAHFGVVLVPAGGRMIEVATFRADGAYLDGRRPSEVAFGSAEADAGRRDFTINGLFEDPRSGEVIDFVGGREDLEQRRLRAIGDPEERFEEDRLRMLRAVRFAARFELVIDIGTRTAIVDRADRLGSVSRERVGQELRRMLEHPSRAGAAWLAEALGLDRSILGAVRCDPETTLTRLAGLAGPEVSWIDALAAWELDRGTASVEDAIDRLGRALVLSNREDTELRAVLRIRAALLRGWDGNSVAGRKRLAARPCFERAVDLLSTEDPDRAGTIRAMVRELARTGLAPTPLIGGEDLLGAGLAAGPLFARVLDEVYDAQLESRVETREEAMRLALSLAEGGTGDLRGS